MRAKRNGMITLLSVMIALSFSAVAAGVFYLARNLPADTSAGAWAESSIPSRPENFSKPEEKTVADMIAEVKAGIGDSDYELPLVGATGYPSTELKLYPSSDTSAEPVKELAAGTAFCILDDLENVWYIETVDGTVGYIENTFCFINLADVAPSIVYNIVNSVSSVFVSSGKSIPGVTGEQLYNTYIYNERFGGEQFIVPVLFSMAKRICAAQQAALDDGNTLVIYESYRPYSVQKAVASGLSELSKNDPEVYAGLNESPWGLGWFISTGVSNHQKGCAIDVSLAKIDGAYTAEYGDGLYLKVSDYTEYEMQTPIHELSVKSVSMAAPASGDAWKTAENNKNMTEGSIMLKKYCTDAGLSPLASEWWHFDDRASIAILGSNFVYHYNFSVSMSRRVISEHSERNTD